VYRKAEEKFPERGLDPSFHVAKSEGHLKVKATEEVDDQENYQNGPQAYAGAAAHSPTAVAVIAASAAKKKDQQND
jgi:hypothetical protein